MSHVRRQRVVIPDGYDAEDNELQTCNITSLYHYNIAFILHIKETEVQTLLCNAVPFHITYFI
jgi:hypothetical protein